MLMQLILGSSDTKPDCTKNEYPTLNAVTTLTEMIKPIELIFFSNSNGLEAIKNLVFSSFIELPGTIKDRV